MVFHAHARGTAWAISLKPESLTLGAGDEVVASWDAGGRVYALADGDRTWRRGLSGTLLEKRRTAHGLERAWLAGAGADAVLARASALAADAADALAGPSCAWEAPPAPDAAQLVQERLRDAARFDAGAARLDAARFAAVYDPVGMLPPDQYLALFVQVTRGCAFNSCTFCDLYRDGYAVKTPEGFGRHVDEVLAFLGDSARLRSRGIFLGAANALAVPMARLEPVFAVMAERLDAVRSGVAAFVDGFTGGRKTVADYERLGRLGLRRVYVGLESGHDPLLAAVRKPATAADAISAVRAMKAAGIAAGVIVMTGLGGAAYAAAHVRDTAAALTAMELGRGDLLYFSELVEPAGRTDGPAGPPLVPDAARRQRDDILGIARFPGDAPPVATYDIREFVY